MRQCHEIKIPLVGEKPRIEFLLTSEDWETNGGELTDLMKSIYEAWQNRE